MNREQGPGPFRPFKPSERQLHGAGPSAASLAVREAMALPTLGHLDPDFTAFMDTMKTRLRRVMNTANPATLPISGPGTTAMEASFVNAVREGDRVVVAVNGVFGKRMAEMARRLGGDVTVLEFTWGQPVEAEAVRRILEPGDVFAFVHAETSTGVLSDAEAICEAARSRGAFIIMDCVTSLAGVEVKPDAWGADITYSGSQKCLSGPPGLAPMSFSQAALERARRPGCRSWFLDVHEMLAYWSEDGGGRAYHHTAPIHTLYGLDAALRSALDEGLDAVRLRHKRAQSIVVDAVSAAGFDLTVPEAARMPMITAVRIPEDLDDAAVRTQLLHDHNVEISPGLGPLAGKIWRLGLMGEGARPEAAHRLVEAFLHVTGRRALSQPAAASMVAAAS